MGCGLLDLYLSVSCHLNASIQELIKILAEFARSHSELAAGAAWRVHHFSGGMVQLSSCVVQVSLSFLEWLGAWRQLHRQTEAETVWNISLCVLFVQCWLKSVAFILWTAVVKSCNHILQSMFSPYWWYGFLNLPNNISRCNVNTKLHLGPSICWVLKGMIKTITMLTHAHTFKLIYNNNL